MRPGQSAPPVDVDDDFYELTEGDLKAMVLTPSSEPEPQGMQTAAMRELAKLQAIKSYSHALVR
eukprot:1165719-Prymnesium_polylepis.1